MDLKRFICTCELISVIQNETLNNTEDDINNQTNDNFINYLLDKINYQVFDCPKIVKKATFSKLINNIGFILGFSFIYLYLISFFIFNCYFIKKIQKQILEIMPKDIKDAKTEIKRNKKKTKTKTKNFPPKKKSKKNKSIKKRYKIKSKTSKVNEKKTLKKKEVKKKKK